MAVVAACKRLCLSPRLPIRLPSVRCYGYVHVPKPKKPHILGPAWKWRKSYEIYPSIVDRVKDPLEKIQWLTKTAVIDSLPDSLLERDPLDAQTIADFECRAREFFAMRGSKEKVPNPLPSRPFVDDLFNSLLPSVWELGKDYSHLLNCSLIYKPRVLSFWKRNEHNFICNPWPTYMLHTHAALDLFHPDVSFKGNDTIPAGDFQPINIGLFLKGYNEIDPFCGYKRGSTLSYCHTMLVTDVYSRHRNAFLAHGLMNLFSQSVALALQFGYDVHTGSDIAMPLTSQAIVTDGRRFAFVCFQLNSLNTQVDTGTWNILWTGPMLELYRNPQWRNPGGFNEECAQLFLKMLTNPPTRVYQGIPGGFAAKYAAAKALRDEDEQKRIRWEERLKEEEERRLLRVKRTQS